MPASRKSFRNEIGLPRLASPGCPHFNQLPSILSVLCLYKSIANSEVANSIPDTEDEPDTALLSKQPSSPERAELERELIAMKQRLKLMERQLVLMEQRTPNKYPDVKFLNYHTRKRILITGGAGFVGSHLVDSLMMAGHEVIVADNFFTGRKRNVEHWLGHENFELIHHDIVNALFIEVDEIYHLASPASPPHYMENPVKTIKTNTLGKQQIPISAYCDQSPEITTWISIKKIISSIHRNGGRVCNCYLTSCNNIIITIRRLIYSTCVRTVVSAC